MVYKIHLAGFGYIHDSSDIGERQVLNLSTNSLRTDMVVALEPKLVLEVNGPGSLDFKLPPSHPAYNAITLFDSLIDVVENGQIIWTGRCISFEQDIYKNKSFHCEGALAFFKDIVLPYKEWESTTPGEFFYDVISQYNDLCDADRMFYPGRVLDDPDDEDFDSKQEIWRKVDYETAWDVLEDMLLDAEGGYFELSKSQVGNGTIQIDYIDKYRFRCSQPIVFGSNMVSINRSANGSGIVTDLVPICHYNDETYTLKGFDEGNYTANKKYKKALHSNWEVRPDDSGAMVNTRLRKHYPRIEKVIEYDMKKNLESVSSLEEKEKKGTLTAEEKIELAEKRASNKKIIRETKYYMYKNSKKRAKQLDRATISLSVNAADLANLRSGNNGTEHADSVDHSVYDEERHTQTVISVNEADPAYNFHIGELVTVHIPALGIDFKEYPITQMTLDLNSGLKDMTIGVPEKKELTKILKPNKNQAKTSYKKDSGKHTLRGKKSSSSGELVPKITFTATHKDQLSGLDEYRVGDTIALDDYKVGLLKTDGDPLDVTASCTFTIGTGQDAVSANNYTFADTDPKTLYAHYTYTHTVDDGEPSEAVEGEGETPQGETVTVELECSTGITIKDSYMVSISLVKKTTEYKIGDIFALNSNTFEVQGRYDDDHTVDISVNDAYIYFNMANGHKMTADDNGFEFIAYYHGPEIYGKKPLTDSCTFNVVDGDAGLGEEDVDGNRLVITEYPEMYTVGDKFFKSRYTVYLYSKNQYTNATIVTEKCIMSIGEGHEFTSAEVGDHNYCGTDTSNPNIGVYATLKIGNHTIASLPVPYKVNEGSTTGANNNKLEWYSKTNGAHTAAFPNLDNPKTTWTVGQQFNHELCTVLLWYNSQTTYYNVTRDTSIHWNLTDSYVFTEEDIKRAESGQLFIQTSMNDNNDSLKTEPLHITITTDQAPDDPYNSDRFDFDGYPQTVWAAGTTFNRAACPTHHYVGASGYGGNWYPTTTSGSAHYMLDTMELTENYAFNVMDNGKTLWAWFASENGRLDSETRHVITVKSSTDTSEGGYQIKFTSTRLYYNQGETFSRSDFPVGQYPVNDPTDIHDVSASGTHWNLEGHKFTKEEAEACSRGSTILVTATRLVGNDILEVVNPAHITVVPAREPGESGKQGDRVVWLKPDDMPTDYGPGEKIYHDSFPVGWYDKNGDFKGDLTNTNAAHYTISGEALVDGREFTQAEVGRTYTILCGCYVQGEMLYTPSGHTITIRPKAPDGEVDNIKGGIEWKDEPNNQYYTVHYTIGDYFNRNDKGFQVVQVVSDAGGSSQSQAKPDITSRVSYNIRDDMRFTIDNESEWSTYETQGVQANFTIENEIRTTIFRKIAVSRTAYTEVDQKHIEIDAVDESLTIGIDSFDYSNFPVTLYNGKTGQVTQMPASACHYRMSYGTSEKNMSDGYAFVDSDEGWHDVYAWVIVENSTLRTETPARINIMKSKLPGVPDQDDNTVYFKTTPTLYARQPFSLKGFEFMLRDKNGGERDITTHGSTSYDIPLGYILKASDDGRTLTGYWQQGNGSISNVTTLDVLETFGDGKADTDGNMLRFSSIYNPWYDGEQFDHNKYVLMLDNPNRNPVDVTNHESTTWSIPDGQVLKYDNHPSLVRAFYRAGNHALSQTASIQVLQGYEPGKTDADGNVLRFTRTHGQWQMDETFALTDYEVTWYNKYGDPTIVTTACRYSGISEGYVFKGNGTDPGELTAFFRVGNHSISAVTAIDVSTHGLLYFSTTYSGNWRIGDTFTLTDNYVVTYKDPTGNTYDVTERCTYNIGVSAIGGAGEDYSYSGANRHVIDGNEPSVLRATYRLASGYELTAETPLNVNGADFHARPDSLVYAAGTVLMDGDGNRTPMTKSNDGWAAACIIVGSEGSGTFGTYVISTSSSCVDFSSEGRPGKSLYTYNNKTFYLCRCTTGDGLGTDTTFTNPQGLPVLDMFANYVNRYPDQATFEAICQLLDIY